MSKSKMLKESASQLPTPQCRWRITCPSGERQAGLHSASDMRRMASICGQLGAEISLDDGKAAANSAPSIFCS